VLVDVTPRIETVGVKKIVSFMASGLDGFTSLEEAAAAVRAYNPHRTRQSSPDGLRKNLRERDGRWYWHWDPAFMKIRDEPARDLIDNTARTQGAARNVTVPALLVRGQQSDVVSEQGVAELRALLPTVETVDVSQAGHMVAGDDNDVFTDAVSDFLERARA
jgi:pimeloyl-ACP methyl ester carboxylesterase